MKIRRPVFGREYHDPPPIHESGTKPRVLYGLSRVEAEICHATDVQKHALANTCKTKEHVLANDATRHNAGALHVNMRLGKALFRAAVRTLSLCGRNIYRENFAQFPGGSVTVKVVHR